MREAGFDGRTVLYVASALLSYQGGPEELQQAQFCFAICVIRQQTCNLGRWRMLSVASALLCWQRGREELQQVQFAYNFSGIPNRRRKIYRVFHW